MIQEDKKNEAEQIELPEVKDELSKVSVNPKQNIAILIGIAIIGIFIVFNVFFSGSSNDSKKDAVKLPKNISNPPVDGVVNKDVSVVNLPDLPAITPPPLLPEPPKADDHAPQALPQISLPDMVSSPEKINESSDQKKQRMDKKNKAPILSIGGATSTSTNSSNNSELKHIVQQPDYLIASGKIIDAVLETAINSDTGAPQIRAIVSRDIYSESGKNILIPKGSKIFGIYAADQSNNRVNVVWKTIYLNSGIILDINAQLVDKVGRSGEEGRYDAKNKEKFANVVMTSAFSILAAKGIDTLIPPADNIANQNSNTNTATQIRNQAFSLASQNPNPTPQTALDTVNQICTFVQNSVTDKTSSSYTGMVTQCQTLQLSAATSDPKILISQAVSAANSAADQLITNLQNNQTQVQKSATDAYNNITKSVTNMFGQQFNPTITIPQGKAIKIQVMQNYIFPKSLSNNVKMIR